MSQQQLQTPVSVGGKHITGMTGTSIDDQESVVEFLDRVVPLQGASHADVVEYCVEAPMCYAKCLALFAGDRKAGLRNPCQFVGWSKESLLFSINDKHLEVAIDNGSLRVVFLEENSERRSSLARKFIGINGDMVQLPAFTATA